MNAKIIIITLTIWILSSCWNNKIDDKKVVPMNEPVELEIQEIADEPIDNQAIELKEKVKKEWIWELWNTWTLEWIEGFKN